MTADKESIANPLKIKAKKFDQRAQQALSVSLHIETIASINLHVHVHVCISTHVILLSMHVDRACNPSCLK